MLNIKFDELKKTIYSVFIGEGLPRDKAETLALVMAESSLDGVQSHGINRLPLLVKFIRKKIVKIDAEPEIVNRSSGYVQVNGNYAPGILNALFCTDTVIELAESAGIGLAALRNTNHWHRAGTYGWRAAEKGFILIAWTNTIPILPPYPSKINLIGNNPIVVAVPRKNGHIVLDMATSQYSYGKVAAYARQGKPLPVPGGFDSAGRLTNDASAIRNGGVHLPIGYWKGTALTIALDLIAAALSGGRTTLRLGQNGGDDTGMSQIFIAVNPKKFGDEKFQQTLIEETINNFKNISNEENSNIRYPGQETIARRKKYLAEGIPVEKIIWEKIKEILAGKK